MSDKRQTDTADDDKKRIGLEISFVFFPDTKSIANVKVNPVVATEISEDESDKIKAILARQAARPESDFMNPFEDEAVITKLRNCEDLLSTYEVSVVLGVNAETIRRWQRNGIVRAVDISANENEDSKSGKQSRYMYSVKDLFETVCSTPSLNKYIANMVQRLPNYLQKKYGGYSVFNE